MIPPIPSSNAYMGEDRYLINWIRSSGKTEATLVKEHEQNATSYFFSISTQGNFNLGKALQNFQENLVWREENKMDEILNEDFQDLEQKYPLEMRGHDAEGRLLMVAEQGKWDIRGAMAAEPGRSRFLRYVNYVLEKAATLTRDRPTDEEYSFIVDSHGFDPEKHACEGCGQFYVHWLGTLEKYYPNILPNYIVVNAPDSFEVIQKVLFHFFPSSTKTGFKTFDDNKEEWTQEVKKVIPLDQIPKHFIDPKPPKPAVFKYYGACAGCKVPIPIPIPIQNQNQNQ
jgi:hypothetical protein